MIQNLKVGWKMPAIALVALLSICVHLLLRFGWKIGNPDLPLLFCYVAGGLPLVAGLLKNLFRGEFGSDLLAGISIITAVLLGEYLAGVIVILMLSGGETLEQYAVGHASSVLKALAGRMPAMAHLKKGSQIEDAPVHLIEPGNIVVIYPHEICPVDGLVESGHGVMNEAFLTGEPFEVKKAPGVEVISGSINGENALTIQATRRAVDSRYSRIMQVMRETEQKRPKLRRLAEKLGAIYTPIAVITAMAAWLWSGDPTRFLAVLVIATPCPLLIAIPVAIIGSISLAAKRSIIIKNPAALEQLKKCRTAIFDKTGTLTYGEPKLTEQTRLGKFEQDEVLLMAASLEVYSKHPLAKAILAAASERKLTLLEASAVAEHPGRGLIGKINGQEVEITHRKKIPQLSERLPPVEGGLECLILINNEAVALYRFRDSPRPEGKSFIQHLGPNHQFSKLMIVSGDRETEVRYLADAVGINVIHAEQSPEQKLEIVRRENQIAQTVYVGDGINDAPAMMEATIGIAMGSRSEVTTEAAAVVIMENSLKKVDELIHIGSRMRTIALQSAVGGMFLSFLGMLLAAGGFLTPVAGAVGQEIIDIIAVANALRAAWPPRLLSHV